MKTYKSGCFIIYELLSNYTLITGALTMVLSQITSSVTGSVGNFIAI
mgnify:CR=1 FL=1